MPVYLEVNDMYLNVKQVALITSRVTFDSKLPTETSGPHSFICIKKLVLEICFS